MIVEHGKRILHGPFFKKDFSVFAESDITYHKEETPGKIHVFRRIYMEKLFGYDLVFYDTDFHFSSGLTQNEFF